MQVENFLACDNFIDHHHNLGLGMMTRGTVCDVSLDMAAHFAIMELN